MAMNNQLLVSAQALTISISVTTGASASVNLPSQGATVRIVNDGTSAAFVSIGAGTQTATLPGATPAATCCPILPSADVTLRITSDQVLQISAITASGSTTLRVSVSEGV